MCGITGIWNLNRKPVPGHVISAFNDALAHRGPDGAGVFFDDAAGLALGHRRLSILDLTDAGKQPMVSEDGNLVITYNGEIYNFIELRDELKGRGYQFKTRSDTEVVLAAFRAWGKACVHRFNGMWAFAIWDKNNQELFVCRDRFGVKPVYYFHEPGKSFAFASETIAFGHLAGFRKEMDETNLSLTLRNTFYLEAVGETIYAGIKKLKPGHYITVSYKRISGEERWWHTADQLVTVPETYPAQVEQFRELLTDACRLRLRSDVPVGIALSGGLDSSSIYSTIKYIADHPGFRTENLPDEWQTAFIASFPGTSMDEKAYADEVVTFAKGNACYIYPDEKNIADAVCQQITAEDFIYLSPPVVHSIYREMRAKGVKVSLDGHGADEMLFGYSDMLFEWGWREPDEARALDLQETWAGLQANFTGELHDVFGGRHALEKRTLPARLYDRLVPEKLKYLYRNKIIARRDENRWIRKYVAMQPNWQFHENTARDNAFSIPYRKFHTESLPALLRNWDSASMQHGVEIRMPFMDWRLVTYVFSLPGTSKVRNGYSKSILRDAMVGRMPESIRLRRNKIGINAPTIEWFNGPMSAFLSDVASSRSFLESPVWNGPVLGELILQYCREHSWNQARCNDLWPFINAWILQQT